MFDVWRETESGQTEILICTYVKGRTIESREWRERPFLRFFMYATRLDSLFSFSFEKNTIVLNKFLIVKTIEIYRTFVFERI